MGWLTYALIYVLCGLALALSSLVTDRQSWRSVDDDVLKATVCVVLAMCATLWPLILLYTASKPMVWLFVRVIRRDVKAQKRPDPLDEGNGE